MKLFLDDLRKAPSGWDLVRTPHETIALLKTGRVTDLSLDHDLGIEVERSQGDGYAVLLWIEEQVALFGFKPPRLYLHTQNAARRPVMQQAIESIRRISAAKGDTPNGENP